MKKGISALDRLTIDYARVFGIIAVVIGHLPGGYFDNFNPYFYHMPLFFMLSGLVFNFSRPIIPSLAKISREIYLYLIFYSGMLLLAAYAIQKTTDVVLLAAPLPGPLEFVPRLIASNFHYNPIFLVGWFLFCLGNVQIIALLMFKLLGCDDEKRTRLLAPALLLGWLGMNSLAELYSSTHLVIFNYLSQITVGLMFFLTGAMLTTSLSMFRNIFVAGACLLIVHVLIRLAFNQLPIMSWSQYPLGFWIHCLMAACGIYLVLFFASMCASGSGEKPYIAVISKSTKSIMSFHILIFVLLDLAFVDAGAVPITAIGGLKHYYSPAAWGLYVLAAILLPSLIDRMLFRMKLAGVWAMQKIA